jgi:hypothetical protein
MEDKCFGCVAYRNLYGEENPHCGLAVIPCISESLKCPCINCIIKVVCDQTCEAFRIYAQQSNKFRRENYV